jgi:hypothetical protein
MKALRLRVVQHPDPPRIFHFDKFPVSVGRSADCDCSLNVPYVSRLHMHFDSIDERLVVRDEGSRTGTWTASGPRRLPSFEWIDVAGLNGELFVGLVHFAAEVVDVDPIDAVANVDPTDPEYEVDVSESGELPAAVPNGK